MTDAELAAHLAEVAGRLLLETRASAMFSPAVLGKAGDRIANRFLVEALGVQRPDDGLLSEEQACDGARLNKSRVWIVDPVDGTREFGEARADWAVHVALVIDGVAAVGAVALPDAGVVLRSDTPPPLAALHRPVRMVLSRSRAPEAALALADRIGAERIAMGSAGAKAMAVVRGEADIYYHAGGQYEWDSAAPVAVARATGLHCSRVDGSPLVYNCANPYLPDLVICHPDLVEAVFG